MRGISGLPFFFQLGFFFIRTLTECQQHSYFTIFLCKTWSKTQTKQQGVLIVHQFEEIRDKVKVQICTVSQCMSSFSFRTKNQHNLKKDGIRGNPCLKQVFQGQLSYFLKIPIYPLTSHVSRHHLIRPVKQLIQNHFKLNVSFYPYNALHCLHKLHLITRPLVGHKKSP